MKLTSFLSTALLAALALAAPTEKRQSGTVVTTGVQNNGRQRRMELRDMQRNNPDMFNVYLLGLRRMMAVPQDNAISWYQIALIHGAPYRIYDNERPQPDANGRTPANGGWGGGYCTHTMNVFIPWHRPYLALFEQALYGYVQAVAAEYPDNGRRARYQAAARNFRIPYWDWAAPVCSECLPYPKLISQMYLDIDTPNGVQTLMNPLFRYNFTAGPPTNMGFNPFSTWTWTRRYPNSWDVNSAYSQNDLVAPRIANNVASFRQRLTNLLTNPDYKVFNRFSNSAWLSSADVANPDSLESLHDAIHALVGASGHMAYLDFSAYDPVFMLHHAMVDRLGDMWSVLNPDSYVVGEKSQGSTYAWASGTFIDANTGLPPFHKNTNRDLWTSNDVRSTATFGYYYTETPPGVTAASVTRAITQLYGNSASSSRKRDLVALSKRDDGGHYHYICNIASQKFALKSSYAVYIFIGEPETENADQWAVDSNLVGTHGVSANLASAASGGMADMDLLVTGTVPLTEALSKKCSSGELKDLTPESVNPYLQENLNWRVAKIAGTFIAVKDDDVKDLSVTVVNSDVRPPPTDDQLPVWGHFDSMANITKGKAGGHVDSIWSWASTWSVGEYVSSGLAGSKIKLGS